MTSTTDSDLQLPVILFDLDQPGEMIRYLSDSGFLQDGETVSSVSRAGEGNMNFVARVTSNRRSFIVKQSRPWVEKYPTIEAPAERIHVEVAFYHAIRHTGSRGDSSLHHGMPGLLFYDAESLVAIFEDLGDVHDFTALYSSVSNRPSSLDGTGTTPIEDLAILLEWLSRLHACDYPTDVRERLRNRPMRELNHAHIFDIPLQPDNGLDLDEITPGLKNLSRCLIVDTAYVEKVAGLGKMYLTDGPCLLHGDYYPGSWVHSEKGPRVIDPEFAFFGPAEFDLGVCKAHLIMAAVPDTDIDRIFAAYSDFCKRDARLIDSFAGVEIMRRLIGVGQLPMERTLDQKKHLLARSKKLVSG